jgi:hypothetical protein
MNPALKAALMSALVFPGAGQLYLKRAGRACVFWLPTVLAAVYFAKQVYARAQAIADQVLAGTLALDPTLIAARLERDAPASTLMNVAIGVMLVCWVASIIDAWLLGRRNRPLVKR